MTFIMFCDFFIRKTAQKRCNRLIYWRSRCNLFHGGKNSFLGGNNYLIHKASNGSRRIYPICSTLFYSNGTTGFSRVCILYIFLLFKFIQ